jgi:ArsR family transcriptional regulator, arsenate/arsenite/antimonite-responsive transcriptional repressor
METKDAVIKLVSLSQESRLNVFRLLAARGAEGMAAGEIAEELTIPPGSLSFHLNHLRNAGLIESRRDGRSIIYTLCPEAMSGLLRFLTEDCCQGRPELCTPATGMCDTAEQAATR